MQYSITLNKSASLTKGWTTKEVDLKGLFALFSKFRESANKDGMCFVPAEVVGGRRVRTAISKVSMLVYDIDGGQSFDEIDTILSNSGVLALLYTTYSHDTTTTSVKTDAYRKWAESVDEVFPPTQASMAKYLAFAGKTRTNVVFDVSSTDSIQHTGDGLQYIVKHDKVAKFRIIFPLAEPIVTRDLASTTGEAIETYVSIYKGVGDALKLNYDESCATIERLHYMPSCPVGAKEDRFANLYNYEKDENPKLLDYNKFPRAVAEKRQIRTPADVTVIDKDGVVLNVAEWAQENPDFDIEGTLRDALPNDFIKESRSSGDGYHITCPYEHRHSSAGGLGTFVCNTNGDIPWTIHCTHNTCKNIDKHTRSDYLAEYIRQGLITARDLGVVVETRTAVADALGLDPSVLPDVYRDMAEMDPLHPVEDERLLVSDETLTAEEVYVSALNDLTEAKGYESARAAVVRMYTKKCTIDVEEVGNAIGVNKAINKRQLSFLLKIFGKMPDVNTIEIERIAQTKRGENHALKSILLEIVDRKDTGILLDTAIQHTANELLLPKEIVRHSYDEMCSDIYRNELGDLVAGLLTELDDRYAKITVGDRALWLDMIESREKMMPVRHSPQALPMLLKNRVVTITRTTKKGVKTEELPLFDTWQKMSTGIKVFNGTTFIPDGPEIDENNNFNVWNPRKRYAVRPMEGDASPITNHIKEVWCNDDEQAYGWVMMWLASLFQRPGVKINSAVVLTGAEGTGKSIVVDYGIGPMLGPSLWGASADKDHIVGRFNDHLEGKLLWCGEEVIFSGDKASMQKLKLRISAPHMRIEPKGLPQYQVPSFIRFIFTSNEAHALQLSFGDRRYFVVECSTKYVGNKAYFDKLRAWLDNGGREKFLHYLLTFNPSDYGYVWQDLNFPPLTEKKLEQQDLSLDTPDQFFFNLIKYGRLESDDSYVKMISWPYECDETTEFRIPINTLRLAFDAFVLEQQGHMRYGKVNFRNLINKWLKPFMCVDTKLARIENKVARVLTFPPRKEVIDKMVEIGKLSKYDAAYAAENTDSHLPPIQQEF